MEQQPVYQSGYGIQLIHNPEEQQQRQQNFIMASHQENNQQILIADESTGQHIPQMQYIQQQQQQQQQDDGSQQQQQFLIQQQPQEQHQVYYNIQQSPQNVNRIIQQQSQTNLMQQQNQQKHVVLPKVIIQRNPDTLLQSPPPLVDQQSQIQYSFQSPHIDQGQQIIIQSPQQPIKQAIYNQQTGQVISQPQYIQLQQVNTPGTKIIVPQGPIRYSIVARPPQQLPQQSPQQNQLMQVQQVTPDQHRQFRPRVLSTPLRAQRPNSPQLQQIQMQNRPRAPRMTGAIPRLVRPGQPLTQQQRVVQASPINRQLPTNSNQQQFFVVHNQDGQQFLIPANQHQNPPQLVRTSNIASQQQVSQQQAQQQMMQNNGNNNQQQQQQQQQQVVVENEDHLQPTTSTLPKKEGDSDDLENSITATAISKGTGPSPNPSENFRQRVPNATPQRVGIVRPLNVNRAIPPQRNSSLQVIRQRTPQRPQGLQHALGVGERESAKMLVILDNGEQRLITFTLPKETCTVQELLDQVGIEIGADSNIECIENPSPEIDYIVKVGNFATKDTAAMTKAAENHIRQQAAQQQQQQQRLVQRHSTGGEVVEAAKSSAETPKPKLVEGFLAVCNACGFSGVDHAKCERCGRIFTQEVKSVRIPGSKILIGNRLVTKTPATPQERKDQLEALQKKHQLNSAGKQVMIGRGRLPATPVTLYPSAVANRGGRGGVRGPRAKPVAPEIVTLSSDDEEDSNESKSSSKNGADKKTQPVVVRKSFEPTIVVEDTVADDFVRARVTEFAEGEDKLMTSLTCRSIRIGSYKFESTDKVDITNKGIRIVAPSVKNPKDIVALDIQHSEIVKLIVHFSKQLQIIFLYTKPSCAKFIVEELSMTKVNEQSPYFAPLSANETHKKIVLLVENITDENKITIKSIYKATQYEEIINRDANELLVRSNGIPVNTGNNNSNTNNSAVTNSALGGDGSVQNGECKKILTYPPGRGGITINTYDYMCLGSDNYLNDVIIDFYLKFIHTELIDEQQRAKSHIFSQFFYKRLTTMNKDKDNRNQTAAMKRHTRVATWTKNVNLFEKDFVVVPINEQSHWFLAIICFPNLTEPRTMDTDQPIKLVTAVKKQKKKAVQIGNTTITPLTKKEELIELADETSERDEAEGDDSELGSNAGDSDEEEVVDNGQAVKVPCILIFDSLGGAARARVVATLRDYLNCEYKVKFPDAPPRVYSKLNMLGHIVKVPQQLNFTDCGLFLLQYVEYFFKYPIGDFRIPIKSLTNWFPNEIVTRKREDIALLIKKIMEQQNVKDVELPKLEFPTVDGKPVEQTTPMETSQETGDEAFGDEIAGDEDYVPTEDEIKESENASPQKKVYVSSKKRSLDVNESKGGEEAVTKTPKRSKS